MNQYQKAFEIALELHKKNGTRNSLSFQITHYFWSAKKKSDEERLQYLQQLENKILHFEVLKEESKLIRNLKRNRVTTEEDREKFVAIFLFFFF